MFLYSLESALSAQFQGEISQSNVKCDKFYKRLKLISYSPTCLKILGVAVKGQNSTTFCQ